MSSAPAYHTIKGLFDELIDLPSDQQQQRLVELEAKDPTMVNKLRELIRHDQQAHQLLKAKPVALIAESVQAASDQHWQGRMVNGFRIERELGTGGMGQVFLAKRIDNNIDHAVAIKILHPGFQQSPLLKRFSAERQILAALQHPNIAYFVDAGTDESGSPYVVMEYVDGLPITSFASMHALDLNARIQLVLQVIDALSYAHQQLVVHRDIKPSNVLVTKTGQVKLLDFGVAKLLANNVDQTVTRDRAYTLAYAAPEQLLAANVGVTCDVYAAGQLCYELLAGSAPFASFADRPLQLERQILEVPPQSLQSCYRQHAASIGHRSLNQAYARKLQGELEAILQKALRKEPHLRYRSADDLADDLSAYLSARPVRAKSGGAWYRAQKFLARHRLSSALAIGLCVGTVISSIVIIKQNQQLRVEKERAESALAIFNDAMVSADPARVANGQNTVRDVLAQSVLSIRKMKTSQPENFLSLGAGLAEVQFELGLQEDALQLAQELYTSAEQNVRIASKQRSQRLIIQALVALGRYQDAQKEIDIAINSGNAEDSAILAARGQLATAQKQPEKALTLLNLALKKMTPEPTDIVWVYANLRKADALRVSERDDEAIQTMDDLIRQLTTSIGEKHVYTIRSRLYRADQLRRMKRIQPALQEGKELIRLVTASYGEDSSFSGRAHASLASALMADQQYANSIPEWEKALQAYVRSLGPYNRTTLNTRFNLAQMMATSKAPDPLTFAEFERSIADAEVDQGQMQLAAFFRSQYAATLKTRSQSETALAILTQGLNNAHLKDYSDSEKLDYLSQIDENLLSVSCLSEALKSMSWAGRCTSQKTAQQACNRAIEQVCALETIKALLNADIER